MNIFVRSRGIEAKTDYNWVKVTETAQEQIDNFPDLFQDESTNLIYSENPAIVLSRRQGQLLLLITAIKPPNRADLYKRQIRISIAWIGEDLAENEEAFRLLAAFALDDKKRQHLTQEIAEAVPLGGIYGFQADFQKLLGFITDRKNNYTVYSQQLPEQEEKFNKLAQISPDIKQSLVQMLRQFQLPKRDGVLVVSTSNKTEGTLKQAGVWRGISSLVKSPNWKAYYPFPEPLPVESSGELNVQIGILKFMRNLNQSFDNWLLNRIELKVNQKLQTIESKKKN